jgi:hypothetical protein
LTVGPQSCQPLLWPDPTPPAKPGDDTPETMSLAPSSPARAWGERRLRGRAWAAAHTQDTPVPDRCPAVGSRGRASDDLDDGPRTRQGRKSSPLDREMTPMPLKRRDAARPPTAAIGVIRQRREAPPGRALSRSSCSQIRPSLRRRLDRADRRRRASALPRARAPSLFRCPRCGRSLCVVDFPRFGGHLI